MNNEVASLIKNINDDLYERKHFNRVDFINKYSQEKSELKYPYGLAVPKETNIIYNIVVMMFVSFYMQILH